MTLMLIVQTMIHGFFGEASALDHGDGGLECHFSHRFASPLAVLASVFLSSEDFHFLFKRENKKTRREIN